MFRLEGSVDQRYLFVKPDMVNWSIRSTLDAEKEFISSGSAGESCPAHPSNFSINNRSNKQQNSWDFNKAGENKDEKYEEGEVVVRCSVHDTDHALWLVQQGREGLMDKAKVGAFLCEEDNEGRFLLSLSEVDVQIEAAVWNVKATSRIAHKLSTGFVQWLISQANEGNWSKEEVASIVCRKNRDNQLILATLNEETQKQASVFDKAKTCSVAPYMDLDPDFLQWLYQEAVVGRWEKSMVFKALKKVEVDGKTVIVARLKKGKMLFEFSTS